MANLVGPGTEDSGPPAHRRVSVQSGSKGAIVHMIPGISNKLYGKSCTEDFVFVV